MAWPVPPALVEPAGHCCVPNAVPSAIATFAASVGAVFVSAGLLADTGALADDGLLAVPGALAGVTPLAGAPPEEVGVAVPLLLEPPPPPHAPKERAPITMTCGIVKPFFIAV